MFRSRRVFVFSNSSLNVREVRFLSLRMFAIGLVAGLALIGLFVVVNQILGDTFGIGYDRAAVLANENRVLRNQINGLTSRLTDVDRSLARLHRRGNELRLMADLEAIDDDTREASVGGSAASTGNPFLTGEAAATLRDAQSLMDRLTREIRLQQSSYDDIARRLEHNRVFFQHLPAIKPMSGYYSVNGFGMRVHPVLNVYRMHAGVDIIADVGTRIYASADGVVRFAGRTRGGYGEVVEINHGYGYTTLYAHLSKSMVRPGQTVRRGELVALSGRSGLVSGPHLHYEVRRNGAMQNPVDYFFDDVDAARYRVQLASAAR